MYKRIAIFLMLVVVVGAAVGCGGGGGGGNQGNSGSDHKGKAAKLAKQQHKKKGGKNAAVGKAKAVQGVVTKVDTQKQLLWVKPKGAKKSTLLRLKSKNPVKIMASGKKAAEGDIKKGQSAKVRYLPIEVKKKNGQSATLNVARIVRLGNKGGEKTGQSTG